jgi:rRNA small subunit pseudouridine methyltransferase Nep1
MITLILAESSLEIVPKELQNHPSVISYCKRNEKKPSDILLDNSWHFAAMKGIKNEIKRGRPDIVHLTLLAICNTPLYRENKLKVFVHTINEQVISISDHIRLPKSYHRFQGLFEKLFKENKIEADNTTLLELHDMTFEELLTKIKPSKTFGFSTAGNKSTFQDVAETITDGSCIVIGGFQKGHFNEKTLKQFDELKSLHYDSLEAHVVASRILYEYEKTTFI